MAIPKNLMPGNVQIPVTGGLPMEITVSLTDPPTDVSTDISVANTLAMAMGPLGPYYRLSNVWYPGSLNVNGAAGRFICGTATFVGTNTSVSITAPTGASNGDRVFLTQSSASPNTGTGVVMFDAQITGGNLVITARDNSGIAVATAGLPQIFFMIDTAT